MTSDFNRTVIPASPSFRVRGPDDWRALLRTRANMLIVGPRCSLDAFVAAAATGMSEPVWLVGPTQEMPTEHSGTFVLYDASRLDELQQESLYAVLAREGTRPQIVSLSEKHLLVEDGRSPIREDLYYRLNTICLDIDAEPAVAYRPASGGAQWTIRAAR